MLTIKVVKNLKVLLKLPGEYPPVIKPRLEWGVSHQVSYVFKCQVAALLLPWELSHKVFKGCETACFSKAWNAAWSASTACWPRLRSRTARPYSSLKIPTLNILFVETTLLSSSCNILTIQVWQLCSCRFWAYLHHIYYEWSRFQWLAAVYSRYNKFPDQQCPADPLCKNLLFAILRSRSVGIPQSQQRLQHIGLILPIYLSFWKIAWVCR